MCEVKDRIRKRFSGDAEKQNCARLGAELAFRSVCRDWDNVTWTELGNNGAHEDNGGSKNLCLVPTGDSVELCRFDGTFDEGEGESMGEPVKWKYPKNAYPFRTMGPLSQYNNKVGDWVREALQTPGAKNEVYVDGLPGHTGWWDKEGPR